MDRADDGLAELAAASERTRSALLLGLEAALVICRRIDLAGRHDGMLREPIDCVEALEAAIRTCGGHAPPAAIPPAGEAQRGG